jgi:hypothetical protein
MNAVPHRQAYKLQQQEAMGTVGSLSPNRHFQLQVDRDLLADPGLD